MSSNYKANTVNTENFSNSFSSQVHLNMLNTKKNLLTSLNKRGLDILQILISVQKQLNFYNIQKYNSFGFYELSAFIQTYCLIIYCN